MISCYFEVVYLRTELPQCSGNAASTQDSRLVQLYTPSGQSAKTYGRKSCQEAHHSGLNLRKTAEQLHNHSCSSEPKITCLHSELNWFKMYFHNEYSLVFKTEDSCRMKSHRVIVHIHINLTFNECLFG